MSLLIERGGALSLSFDTELESIAQRGRSSAQFAVKQQTADRHVVVPDIHGEYEVLDRIIDRYIDKPDVDFVFLGDLIDRKGVGNDPEKGVFKALEIVKELGSRAVVTMANHEWLFHASSSARDLNLRREITQEWRGSKPGSGIEQNVLAAYDIDSGRRDDLVLKELRKRMARAGHLGVLLDATPYFETENFIATHAGVMLDVPWDVQQAYLADVADEMNEGLFYDRPPQWFSMKLATSTAPVQHTDKVVVSGHAHVLNGRGRRSTEQTAERVIHDGKRVRLASTLNAPTRAPAYVWQDWDGEVIEIERD